jgi:hypothetical protein
VIFAETTLKTLTNVYKSKRKATETATGPCSCINSNYIYHVLRSLNFNHNIQMKEETEETQGMNLHVPKKIHEKAKKEARALYGSGNKMTLFITHLIESYKR